MTTFQVPEYPMDPDEFDRRGDERRTPEDRGLGVGDILLGFAAGILWAAVITMVAWGLMAP